MGWVARLARVEVGCRDQLCVARARVTVDLVQHTTTQYAKCSCSQNVGSTIIVVPTIILNKSEMIFFL